MRSRNVLPFVAAALVGCTTSSQPQQTQAPLKPSVSSTPLQQEVPDELVGKIFRIPLSTRRDVYLEFTQSRTKGAPGKSVRQCKISHNGDPLNDIEDQEVNQAIASILDSIGQRVDSITND